MMVMVFIYAALGFLSKRSIPPIRKWNFFSNPTRRKISLDFEQITKLFQTLMSWFQNQSRERSLYQKMIKMKNTDSVGDRRYHQVGSWKF